MGCGASKAPAVSEPVALTSGGSSTATSGATASSLKTQQEATCTAELPPPSHATLQISSGDPQEEQPPLYGHNRHGDGTPEEARETKAPGNEPSPTKSHPSAPSPVMEEEKASEDGSLHSFKMQATSIVHDGSTQSLIRPVVAAEDDPNINQKSSTADVNQAEICAVDKASGDSSDHLPCLDDDPPVRRHDSPLPVSTGGSFGTAADTVLLEPPSQADNTALEAIAQNNGDNISADKAEAVDTLNEDSDISSVDAGDGGEEEAVEEEEEEEEEEDDDDEDDSGKKEEDAGNSQTVYETKSVANPNLQETSGKRSDLTEAEEYCDDLTNLSHLTELQNSSPFESPPHYGGDFTKYTEDAISSARSEYRTSSPSSSDLDTSTYMQDLLRKITLANESIDAVTEEAISGSILKDLKLSSLFSEKHDLAFPNYGLHEDDKLCQAEEVGSDQEKNSPEHI